MPSAHSPPHAFCLNLYARVRIHTAAWHTTLRGLLLLHPEAPLPAPSPHPASVHPQGCEQHRRRTLRLGCAVVRSASDATPILSTNRRWWPQRPRRPQLSRLGQSFIVRRKYGRRARGSPPEPTVTSTERTPRVRSRRRGLFTPSRCCTKLPCAWRKLRGDGPQRDN